MANPWKVLKELEDKIMDMLVAERVPGRDEVQHLQNLHDQCSVLPDAEEAICYHGTKALLAQIHGNYSEAIAHREIEMAKIQRVYEYEEENSTDGWMLQNYRQADIKKRDTLVRRLKGESA